MMPIDITVSKIDYLEVTRTSEERERPKKTLTQTVRNDLKSLILMYKLDLDWTKWNCKIHIADSSIRIKA